MAILILFASDLVGYVAMPALAGLLIVIGIGAIKPSRIYSVVKSGPLPTAIMAVTFGLTLVIPLQFAVLVGVGLGIILFVAQQSNRVRVRQVHVARRTAACARAIRRPTIAAGEVVILQPYGSLFFASAPIFEHQLPAVSRASKGAVVIIRLRGTDQIGLSLIEVLRRYAHDLRDADAALKLVISEKQVLDQVLDQRPGRRAGGGQRLPQHRVDRRDGAPRLRRCARRSSARLTRPLAVSGRDCRGIRSLIKLSQHGSTFAEPNQTSGDT